MHLFFATQGVVFVIDSTNRSGDLPFARKELVNVLLNKEIKDVPVLVILNDNGEANLDNNDDDLIEIRQIVSDRVRAEGLARDRIKLIAGNVKDVKMVQSGIDWMLPLTPKF